MPPDDGTPVFPPKDGAALPELPGNEPVGAEVFPPKVPPRAEPLAGTGELDVSEEKNDLMTLKRDFRTGKVAFVVDAVSADAVAVVVATAGGEVLKSGALLAS